jgi:hypothetical protein
MNGGQMQVSQILTEIDTEIARLQEARNLLAGEGAGHRSRGVKRVETKAAPRRKLTAEGRRKISEAMKRRWAERKKQSTGKAAKGAAKAK